MTDEQVAFGFDFFGGRVVGKVGIAESALDRRGLDGLSANRAGFAIWVHDDSSFQVRISMQAEICG